MRAVNGEPLQDFLIESRELPARLDRDFVATRPVTAPILTAMSGQVSHSHGGSSRARADRSCDLLGMATCHVEHPNRLLRSNMLSPHQIFRTQDLSRPTRVG